MNRFSLSNSVLSISHRQFIKLTSEFKRAATKVFGQECVMEVRVMNTMKLTSHFDDGFGQATDDYNKANTAVFADDAAKISRDAWKRAVYVEAIISPLNQASAPSGFAHAEFKGETRRQATFYIQGQNPSIDADKIMRNANPMMWPGDGYSCNTEKAPFAFGIA